jgi:hypothetical protein
MWAGRLIKASYKFDTYLSGIDSKSDSNRTIPPQTKQPAAVSRAGCCLPSGDSSCFQRGRRYQAESDVMVGVAGFETATRLASMRVSSRFG